MKKNIAKNYINKIVAAMFCLVMLIYNQCGYAVIEKFLQMDVSGHVNIVIPLIPDDYEGMEWEITPTIAGEIVDAIKSYHIGSLQIQHSTIPYRELGLIANALSTNKTLMNLSLDDNELGDEGAREIANALQVNTILVQLDLNNNKIGIVGVQLIANALCTNKTLRRLSLRYNNIDENSVVPLINILKLNTPLINLDLNLNNICNRGAMMLAEALVDNHVLLSLDIGRNNIRREGAIAMAKTLLVNTTLTTLNFADNNIGDEGGQALAKSLLHNTALTALNLRYNQIGVEGIRTLVEALRHNTTLTTVDLEGNQIDVEESRTVDKILLRNSLLVNLLRKLKRGSAFMSAIGLRGIRYESLVTMIPSTIVRNILEFAGLDVRNRDIFENIQDYNNEDNRRIVFRGSLKEVIRLFYYGNHVNYEGIIREVNQIRQLQREIFHIPESELPVLPENIPRNIFLTPNQEVATIFFGIS
jgi:Ran GTPase-activating protein (RanGAP) involved in mRNA processing and transport